MWDGSVKTTTTDFRADERPALWSYGTYQGAWLDDGLTPAGVLRYREARTSLYQDGVELIRVTGEDQVSAVANPGTRAGA
jgi:hypothetical protein